MTTRRLLAVAIAAAASMVALSGCSVIDSFTPKPAETRDSESGEIVDGGNTDIFTLQVGDCLNDESTSEEISDVPTVNCSEPHQYEVYGSLTLDGDEWPGDDTVGQEADAGCLAQFESFAGIAYENSMLDYNYYVPTEGGWNQLDDREVLCVIFDAEPTTGSLAGAAR